MAKKRNGGPGAAGADDTVANPLAARPAARELEKNPRLMHGVFLPGSVYRHQLKEVVGDDQNLLDTALAYMIDVMGDFKPRDPAERMLVAQMVHTHARFLNLTTMATQQQNLKWAAMMHEAADRASNVFRRQMLALAEYRRPPRPAKQFTSIGQANIANQQVVQNNGNLENGKATNEQGCLPGPADAAPVLPADAGGAGGPAAVGGAGAAVGVEHRPADCGGEGGGEP
jgi:hypothetical protein